MTKRPAEVPDGDPARVARLLQVEGRLGARFPASYRDFVANRPRYRVQVKRVSFFEVERCERDGHVVVIGRSAVDGPAELVFKVGARGVMGEAVFERSDRGLVRHPAFGELVEREKTFVAAPDDDRVRAAELLAGVSRKCPRCGRALRVGQLCDDGHIGHAADARYALSAEEGAALAQTHPRLSKAWAVLLALKAGGFGVPMGSNQVLALADALEAAGPDEAARRLLNVWKEKGLKVTAGQDDLRRAIEAVEPGEMG